MKRLLMFLWLVTLIACDKTDDKNSDAGLTGEWGLTEILADPGDGSGTFQPVQSNKTITFHSNGTVTCNGSLCDMSATSNQATSGTYSTADSTLGTLDCNLQMKLKFEKTGSTLIIQYPCIEPCKAKYEKN